ncbi:MAG: 7-alpha-hydroxysteroid dehydrogenase [Alphaproteobacteria bacterium MarineAlpha4_Bin2]|nr:MAG: 7-alpha-hydroxysteroid dehydrogenase [Alphaproteobacteria bacterium MarineAlpha4_Bin2]
MELGLKGKGVIVTGGTRGIGFAIADAFAQQGCRISICGRTSASLSLAQEKLTTHGGVVHAAVCDVGDVASLESYIQEAHVTLGRLDVLVNNPSGFGRTDDEEGWKRSIDIDLMPVIRGSHLAIPLLEKAGGGSIIHISTISALTESIRTPPYGAIKAAVNHYTVTQAKSLAPKGIRVNAICPGSIYFEGGVWDEAKKNNPDLFQSILASIPSGRYGTPEDIASVAVFLGSDAGKWVTGQAIAVDGGQAL